MKLGDAQGLAVDVIPTGTLSLDIALGVGGVPRGRVTEIYGPEASGKTTGPHLNFEVRVGKNEYFSSRNPDLWISPPQGWGILVGQILTYGGRLLEQQPVYLYRMGDTEPQDESSNQLWIGKSYQNQAINSDPYYRENLSIANIPAGTYMVSIPVTYIGLSYQEVIEIHPGQVTFFKFNLWRGFTGDTPPTPEVFFSPSP